MRPPRTSPTSRSRFARFGAALAVGSLCVVQACADPSGIVADLRVIAPDGGAPLEGAEVDTLRVRFAQAPNPITSHEVAVDGEAFDLALPLDDLNAETFVALEFTGPSDRLVGALPLHTPSESRLSLAVVVGPSGTCAKLEGVELASPASHVGGAAVGTFGFLIGGDELSTASRRVGYVDLLRPSSGSLGDAPAPLGATQAVAVTRNIALVLPTRADPFFYDLNGRGEPILPVTIHDGARDGGVLIAATGLGAAVVGGSIGGMPSAGLTYVRNDGTSTASGLARARRGAAAAFDGTHLWVAGGEGEGASSLELASFGASPAVVITELEDAVRSGGVLLVSEDGREALLIGGRDEVGTLRSDSVWIHGCPSSCTAEPGPAWTRARQGAVALPSERLLVGGAGSSEVERVDFTADGPVLVARGALYVPRADPALIPIAEGIFVAVGGHDGSGPRRDSEICFP